jgi:pseudouridine-5'-phosphate glycosidase
VIVANPLPPSEQLDPALHDRVLTEALAGIEREHITGKAVTPYLLAHFHEATGGRSLDVNVRIILRNAALAAQIAVALQSVAGRRRPSGPQAALARPPRKTAGKGALQRDRENS